MRCLLVIPFLLISISLRSGQPKDSIPPAVEAYAKIKTDKQIDSIYKHSPVPPIIDALKYNFQELRTHMDSLNAQDIIRQREYEVLAVKRDSALRAMFATKRENRRLKAENHQYWKEMNFMAMLPGILILFTVVVAASLFVQGLVQGIIIGVKKIKNEK